MRTTSRPHNSRVRVDFGVVLKRRLVCLVGKHRCVPSRCKTGQSVFTRGCGVRHVRVNQVHLPVKTFKQLSEER